MPIWASKSGLQGIRLSKGSENAAFVYRFADCHELFLINQRFPNEVVQTQVRGRYCGDLDRLYLHDANAPLIAEAVPKEFLGRPLFKEEKDELCKLLNLLNPDNGRLLKWPSIKKILSKSGYMVSEDRSGNLRCSVIRLA